VDTRNQNIQAKGARGSCFLTIAAEKHPTRTSPTPAPINANLKLYTDAMAEVEGRRGGVQVTFSRRRARYAQAKPALTINGVHLADEGYGLRQ